jgi:hypothetical protein
MNLTLPKTMQDVEVETEGGKLQVLQISVPKP